MFQSQPCTSAERRCCRIRSASGGKAENMRVYARELNEHLPSLRRYARALTGSVDRGDDLVTRGVDGAVMAPTRFGLPGNPSGPLYALLHALFDQDGEGRPVKSQHPIERVLAR